MKFRDKNLILVRIKMTDRENFIDKIISYDTLEKILHKKVDYWVDKEGGFYASELTSTIIPEYGYLKDIKKLIKLEESNKEAELIVGKKKLIDKLENNREKINMNVFWAETEKKRINAVIKELKID